MPILRLFLGIAIVLLPLAVHAWPASPELTPPARVWIIGDSLTRGLFASSEAATYRNQLIAALQTRYPGRINATFWEGVCTLAGLEQQWGGWPGKPDLVFIELGINDLTNNPNCPQVPEAEWQARYGAMLDRIRQGNSNVQIVVGTVPWSAWQMGSSEWDKALTYSGWMRAEAEARGLGVADLWAASVNRPDGISRPDQPSVFPPFFRGDNFHPNDTGHARLAATFLEAYVQHYEMAHRAYLPRLQH